MAIEKSGFTHWKWVIFHSYVKLPEGNTMWFLGRYDDPEWTFSGLKMVQYLFKRNWVCTESGHTVLLNFTVAVAWSYVREQWPHMPVCPVLKHAKLLGELVDGNWKWRSWWISEISRMVGATVGNFLSLQEGQGGARWVIIRIRILALFLSGICPCHIYRVSTYQCHAALSRGAVEVLPPWCSLTSLFCCLISCGSQKRTLMDRS